MSASNIGRTVRVLFFDSETTGLPMMTERFVFPHYKELDKYNSCRLIELGYIITDEGTDHIRETKKYNSLVIPPCEITNSEIHGITTEEATLKGNTLTQVLSTFIEDLSTVDLIVAHNIEFDLNVVCSELFRNARFTEASTLFDKPKMCTMEISRKKYGYRRKLCDLYEELSDQNWKQTHRAMDDAEKCKECYFLLASLSSGTSYDEQR